MLVKEYRIPLPLSVKEYQVAQLYMIAKKSREETKGAESGVEIMVNEPYSDGPGGSGQYTRKVYHIGSHLPGWLKTLLPKSVLMVEEEAWNAYPYTKTRYTCPFVEKFYLEIETKYINDGGEIENVFQLPNNELKQRTVDVIDLVRDPLVGSDYRSEEDPTLFISEKTKRGPLSQNWIEEYCQYKQNACSTDSDDSDKDIMCAYKLCRVEFKYWGMQSKIERFIHDTALRRTMLRAHRQAWAWQDEWVGLTIEDIRRLEKETQEELAKTMSGNKNSEQDDDQCQSSGALTREESNSETTSDFENEMDTEMETVKKVSDASLNLSSQDKTLRASCLDLQMGNLIMETIVQSSDLSSEEEYFDAEDEDDGAQMLARSCSEAILECTEKDDNRSICETQDDSIFSAMHIKKVQKELFFQERSSRVVLDSVSLTSSPSHRLSSSTNTLILILHAGSILDSGAESIANKKSDIATFISAFKNITQHNYPGIMGHISIRLVSCPSICSEALAVLSNLSPYSFQASPSAIDGISNTYDSIPIGALCLFATSSPEYQEHVSSVISSCNQIYREFLSSDEGKDFGGQVVIVGDSVGAIMAYDALCRTSQIGSHFGSETSIADTDQALASHHYSSHSALFPISNTKKDDDEICGRSCIHSTELGNGSHDPSRHSLRLSSKLPRQCSSGSNDTHKFEFDVNDFFMFGSPLGTILAYRKMMSFDDKNSPPAKPLCNQVYNLFHPTDPLVSRIEPLLNAQFAQLPPVNVSRHQKHPSGNGNSIHLLDYIQMYSHLFMDSTTCTSPAVNRGRRPSEASLSSNISGVNESIPLASISSISQRWWGTKRLDYALYCPDGLANFPLNALPYLFHASYWESTDVIAFILRQIIRINNLGHPTESEKEAPLSQSSNVREKWLRKRTSVKLKNITANHRANDVLVKEGNPQVLNARFMYGPLDMVALTGEKIDIHVMKDIRTGEWTLFSTEVTDKNGRISYVIRKDKLLTYGIFPVRMTVRGDRTFLEFLLAVVPQKTECVVFSIDGSFTASVSVTGKDPKVRAGAVDVVRHWQELGYVIIYITGRPDMQQQRVISWLAQHNFPRGLVSFADGLSTDPLRHKAEYLRNLQKNEDILIHAAYGSSKDIWVYSSLGLKPEQVFTIGKVSKKQHSIATVLANGYAIHLSNLKAPGGSRPAQGNARMILPHGGFTKPGQALGCLQSRRSAKRTTSYPLSGQNDPWPKSPSIKNN